MQILREINFLIWRLMQMAFYECTFIMRQDISSQDVYKAAERFVEIVKSLGGELIKKEYWGLRNLAYIVRKNKKGHYMMLCLSAPDVAMKELERNFKINEDVIKFFNLKVEKIDESPSYMMQAPADSGDLSSNSISE